MIKNKSVLIIVYSYSSIDGVGSRRWIKYSHELANMGIQVFVLTEKSRLNKEEIHPKISYSTFKSNYPKILETSLNSFSEKIKYQVSLKISQLLTKGSPYDKSVFDEKLILESASNIISSNNIDNLIVSAAPFRLLTFGVKLKIKFPNINYVADLRDPWIDGHIFGMNSISRKRKRFEIECEKQILENADCFIVASGDIKSRMNKRLLNSKIEVLINGIEKKSTLPKFNKIKKIKKITHIGTINTGTSEYWKPFLKHIIDSDIYIDFIGLKNPKVIEYIKSLDSDKFSIVSRVQEDKLPSMLSDTSAFLMFKKDGFENSFPSKFFNYIKYRLPIICYTKSGNVSSEIESNNIGFILNETTSNKEIDNILESIFENKYNFNGSYQWDKFSIESLCEKLKLKLI